MRNMWKADYRTGRTVGYQSLMDGAMNKETLSIYCDRQIKDKLEERAEEENRPMSRVAEDILKENLLVEDRAKEIGVEQRVENIVAEAKDSLREIPESIKDIQAKQGVYTIALWELLKHQGQSSDTKRVEALSTGSKRLRKDLEEVYGDEVEDILEDLEDLHDHADHGDDQGNTDPLDEMLNE